ncbi:MAG TPA: thioredoxin family protein [bacterium]|nr:thioredoxin family protein [bacterium]
MPERHTIVSHDRWLEARRKFLVKEKAFTRLRDRLSAQRRALPWERVDKKYVFDGPDGKETLAALFEGRHQLVVYHFMFLPEWHAGCPSCSFWADNFDDNIVHLAHRDVTMVAISRAPYRKLAAYKKRMGWQFKWLSSFGNDFNFDYQASFRPDALARGRALYNFKIQNPGISDREGVSVFYKTKGAVFHTYSAYARGIDMLNTAYHYLDLVPKGRDEAGHAFTQFWVRRHDEYDRPARRR